MSSPAVARLLQIQQELTELQTLSKPTPDALQRLQVLANELQALQVGPAPCAPPPAPRASRVRRQHLLPHVRRRAPWVRPAVRWVWRV